MANNRATKSGFAAEAQRKVSTIYDYDVTLVTLIFLLFILEFVNCCAGCAIVTFYTPMGCGTGVFNFDRKTFKFFSIKVIIIIIMLYKSCCPPTIFGIEATTPASLPAA